ncbi:MAG: DUF4357 domain-containing protein [Sphingobacteriaceae bacterium]|nr:DUF4357 domain-containing protein [Sphingobacteriaceae bacterium]
MPQFYGRRGKHFIIPSFYNQATVLFASDGGTNIATGKWTTAGFILAKGSLIRKVHTLKSNPGVINTKNKLLQTSLLIQSAQNNYYQLQEDILLSSPSTAARLVFGNDRNGDSEWKDAYGDSLGSLIN